MDSYRAVGRATDMTEREKDVYTFILNYIDINGYSPSWRDIQKGIYTNSHTNVKRLIYNLKEKGYIAYTPRTSRSIVVL